MQRSFGYLKSINQFQNMKGKAVPFLTLQHRIGWKQVFA